MSPLTVNPLRVSKFLVALAGAGAQIVATGLVDSQAEHWVNIIVAVLTALAVFLVKNEPGDEPTSGVTLPPGRPRKNQEAQT